MSDILTPDALAAIRERDANADAWIFEANPSHPQGFVQLSQDRRALLAEVSRLGAENKDLRARLSPNGYEELFQGQTHPTHPRYLILSTKRPSDYWVFYRPNAAGYTENVTDAGRYTKEDAERHCAGIDYLTPIAEADLGTRIATRTVIDNHDGDNWQTLDAIRNSPAPADEESER